MIYLIKSSIKIDRIDHKQKNKETEIIQMLEFAQDWSWQLKSFIAMVVVLPIMVLVPMMENRFGLKTESFFIAWFGGCFASFIMLAKTSSKPSIIYFTPFWPMIAIFILAFLLGGPGNILLIQAMSLKGAKVASNPALPFAIVGLASTTAYILTWLGGKIFPSIFPVLKFNSINLMGLVMIALGVTAVIYQKTGG